MKFFENVNAGDTSTSPEYLITREEIIEMATKWDPQPIHIDEEHSKNGFFGDIIACTAHLFSILSRLNHQIPDDEKIKLVAGLGFGEGKIHRPVLPDTKLHMVMEITEARPSNSNPGWGIISTDHKLYTQDGDLAFSMTSTAIAEKKSAE